MGGPVFSKPTAAAPPLTRPDTTHPVPDFKLPTTNPFSIPAAMALGMGTKFNPLSAQSSKASIFSDVVFDTQSQSPQPSTQDTSYSAGASQSQPKTGGRHDELDEIDDDSWGVEDKFAGPHMWTPYGFASAAAGGGGGGAEPVYKDDTMTWSTFPSRSTSQKGGDTGPVPTESFFGTLPPSKEEEEEEAEGAAEEEEEEREEPERGFAQRMAEAAQEGSEADDQGAEEADMAMEIDDEDEPERTDLEDEVLASKPTIKLVPQVCHLLSRARPMLTIM